MLNKARKGFTLIELLIVVVIIGVLAAIAIPKFSKSRERAYFSAMRSDLRNLATAQEIYYSANSNYASATSSLPDFNLSKDVSVTLSDATSVGYAATSGHKLTSNANQTCVIYYGTVGTKPTGATSPGIVTCNNE